MQALTPSQYAELQRLVKSWERRYLRHAKEQSSFNPKLAADALCFQRWHEDEGELLVGALITPLTLSLMLVPVAGNSSPPLETVRWLSLPAGNYPLTPLVLDERDWVWHCVLLEDVSDINSLEQGSRLAQRLVTSLMAAP
ncbi:[NiFe]-hydrogenase assembly chaperone HybE [Halomonas halocynthiae]|uniref:[NiFe]-hydrogenase assembly chaperone HybE n=1 Tax=Halomonas halocynthiae TaxID=176290 RepID=UPI000411223F|nr:[NiFe]-hydrogenase assembly chaperone HybE [Halomonas halocynthiae]